MKSLVKALMLFLALVVILGCQKEQGAFEKMGREMDKTAADMNKALRDVDSK